MPYVPFLSIFLWNLYEQLGKSYTHCTVFIMNFIDKHQDNARKIF